MSTPPLPPCSPLPARRRHPARGLGWVAGVVAVLAAGSAAVGPASAQSRYYGWTVAGGYPSTFLSARADWSSDLGPDYVYSNDAVGDAMTWIGNGSSTGPTDSRLLSGSTVSWVLNSRGGAAGDTYSGGSIGTSPETVLNAGGVFVTQIHLYSVVGVNDPGYGIDTKANLKTYFFASSAEQPYAPMYYRIDWTLARSGNVNLDAMLSLSEGHYDSPLALTGASGVVEGQLGSASYWYGGDWQNGTLEAWTYAGDGASPDGSGRIDLWATVTMSRQPLAAVPEPATPLQMAGGLGAVLALGAQRRRRAGAPQGRRGGEAPSR